jgi:hypothetical protein
MFIARPLPRILNALRRGEAERLRLLFTSHGSEIIRWPKNMKLCFGIRLEGTNLRTEISVDQPPAI